MSDDIVREHLPSEKLGDQLDVRLRGFQDGIPHMVWSVRVDGSIEYVNRRWEEYTGLTSEQMKDWKWIEIVHPDDKKEFLDKWHNAMRSGEHFIAEIRLRRVDGVYRWHSLKDWPAREEDGRIIRWFGTATDVEESRQLLDQLQKTNLELSQFASIAAHDLQEPLRMVGSFITLLQRKYGSKIDDTARGYITKALEATEHMRVLVADLLEFSRAGHGNVAIQEVDASDVLSEVEVILKKSITDTDFEIAHGDLPIVSINRSHLLSLMQNLVGNGVKYHRPGIMPKIEVSAADQGQEWVFTVRDNGIGIAPCDYSRIFEIFTRLHSRSEFSGTGIGLTICQKIITFYKGRIWVEPGTGDGSTFKFSLPKIPAGHQPAKTKSANVLTP